MNGKATYIDFCKKHDVPLYLQPFWLDSVCGEANWGGCVVTTSNGQLRGALPFHVVRKYGLTVIKNPPLTDYTGFIFNFDNSMQRSAYRQDALELETMQALIEQLPAANLFYQQYDIHFNNWLPFYWKGYRQTTLYTYRLEEISDLSVLFANFKATVRTNIRKAENLVDIVLNDDLIAFYQLNVQSFQKQGMHPPYDFKILEKLDNALKVRSKRRIYFAKGKEKGELHAALYIVWDEQTAYFMLWGMNPNFAESRALQFVFWQAIQDFSTLTQHIDFCGSVLPSIEKTLRAFGAVRKPCYNIYKMSNKFLRVISVLLNKLYT